MQDLLPFVMKYWYLWLALVSVIVMIFRLETLTTVAGLPSLSPEEVVSKINHNDAMIIDARDHNAYANGHILGSHHILPGDLFDKKKPLPKEKETPVILVDLDAKVLPKFAENLRSDGFTNVFVMKGGMQAWRTAGLPLSKKH